MTMLLADIYMKKGMLRDAHDQYQSLVRGKTLLDNKEIARAYLLQGKILNREKDFKKARKALVRSIAIAEKNNDNKALLQSAYMELGGIFQNEKKYQQAIKAFELGFTLGYGPDNNDYWKIRFRLALLYLATDKLKEAEPLLNDILEGGDTILQQKAQVRLGTIKLDKQLGRLTLMPEMGN
jgi:tetratricopeptide (TPR) repeat protein